MPGDGKIRVRLDKKMTRVNSIDQDTLAASVNPQIDVNYMASGRGPMNIVDERALVDISGDILNTVQGTSEANRMVTKNCENDGDQPLHSGPPDMTMGVDQ